MAAHAPLQPAGVNASSMNLAFITGLQVQDRSFLPDLIDVYGNQNYTHLLEMLGQKEEVTNQAFYHYETRGKLHAAIQVSGATTPASPTAGQSVTVTLASGSHFSSGTQSPIRVGEVVTVSASGVQAKCTAVNKVTASAHTATFAPLRTTDVFAPAANDWLLFDGVTEAGEASDAVENIQNLTRKVTNTITEIREDFKITDKAAMERLEWAVDGVRYYKYKGTKDAEKRFLNNVEGKLVFGVNVTNTTASATSLGTLGLIPQIASGGSDLPYTAGSLAITDYQSVVRQMDFNGAPSELHQLSDPYQYQEIMRTLFALYPSGAVLWDSVGGSAEAAAKYGFKSLQIENYNIHFKKYAPFSPEWKYGVAPATASAYKNYGIIIPQGMHTDPRTSEIKPVISVVWQSIPNAGEFNAYESGGLALQNKTTKQELINTIITHKGLRLRAANQCVILNG